MDRERVPALQIRGESIVDSRGSEGAVDELQ